MLEYAKLCINMPQPEATVTESELNNLRRSFDNVRKAVGILESLTFIAEVVSILDGLYYAVYIPVVSLGGSLDRCKVELFNEKVEHARQAYKAGRYSMAIDYLLEAYDGALEPGSCPVPMGLTN